ncbi:MAG: outer membrane protein transport protein [Polyangiaceae bacterium]|nr:outer membrane protein transport protein [Polyangiaceae bacterium]
MRARAAVAAVLLVAPASANPLGTYGFGSREAAMGAAVTADTSGASATFYNPAGLARAERLTLELGHLQVNQRLLIDGRDTKTDPVKGLSGGVVAPGELFRVPFAFGLGVHLPDDRLSRIRTMRQDIPRWELYDNRAQLLFIGAMLAVRPARWLAIGGGVAFLSSTRGDFAISGRAQLDSPYDSQLRHQVDADLTTVRVPYLGVRVDPSDRWSLGLSYRGESKLDLRLDADIKGEAEKLGIVAPVRYTLGSRSFDAFQPRQLTLGVSTLPHPRVRANMDLTYVQWSSYESATSRSTSHLEISGVDGVLAVPPDTKPTVVKDPEFRDRVVPRVGVEGWVIDARVKVAARAGYVFERSPVPPQTGTTNFVDADRHTVSLGAGVRVPRPADVLEGELRLDVHAAWSFLPERRTVKDNPADFVGGYRASGRQTSYGATLGVLF